MFAAPRAVIGRAETAPAAPVCFTRRPSLLRCHDAAAATPAAAAAAAPVTTDTTGCWNVPLPRASERAIRVQLRTAATPQLIAAHALLAPVPHVSPPSRRGLDRRVGHRPWRRRCGVGHARHERLGQAVLEARDLLPQARVFLPQLLCGPKVAVIDMN